MSHGRGQQRLVVASTWDGEGVGPEERVTLTLSWETRGLWIRVAAPYWADPAPREPPGPVDRLWEFEVVEVFLLGSGEHYLEIELGPHGHSLVLELHPVRTVVRQREPLAYTAKITGRRWEGEAFVPVAWLPAGVERLNAFAVHGCGPKRRYLAWRPTGGPRPDFHRLEVFGAIETGDSADR